MRHVPPNASFTDWLHVRYPSRHNPQILLKDFALGTHLADCICDLAQIPWTATS